MRRICYLLIFSVLALSVRSQENSPYSRYGIGDVIPTQNILNRSMGGLSLAYWDLQSINFSNPASYSRLKVTTFDVGLEYDSRNIRSAATNNSFRSAYLIPTYINIGFPVSRKKNWGMNLGLKPVTRISYDITQTTRLAGIDSVFYRYQGNGGSYQAFMGLAYGTKKLSVGINAGWMFGTKDLSTRINFINDTVRYERAKYSDSTSFGGLFLKAGIQYQLVLSGDLNLRLGATYGLQNTLNAKRDLSRETYQPGLRGDVTIDSVFKVAGQKGEVVMPSSFGAAIMLDKVDKWMVGVEFNSTAWSDYRFYGQADAVRNNWTLRVGGQLVPGITSKNYWNRVAYRAGFYYGPDYVNLGQNLNTWAASFGLGLPIRRNYYTNQYTTLNLTGEVGGRGNRSNAIRESLLRITVGFNLSDIWFTRRQYQ